MTDIENIEDPLAALINVENGSTPPETVETSEEVPEFTEETALSTDDEESKDNIEENEEDVEIGVIDSLIQDLGYTPNEDIQYENSREGAARLVNDISSHKATQAVDEYLDKVPMLRQYHTFLVNGGKAEDFFNVNHPSIDYGKLDIDDNEANQSLVISEALRSQGLDEDIIASTIKMYATTGILDRMAQTYQPILKRNQEQASKDLLEKTQVQRKEKEEQATKYWEGVINTINKSDTIKGLSIPIKDKQSFINYMAFEKENGLSQWQIDIQNENQGNDIETPIALAYLRYKKFDLSGLIKREASSQIATQKKYGFSKGQTKNVSSGSPITRTNVPDDIHARLLRNELD